MIDLPPPDFLKIEYVQPKVNPSVAPNLFELLNNENLEINNSDLDDNELETDLFDLEKYFLTLTTISKNKIFQLPSGNTFKITDAGIEFVRTGKRELWKISAKTKGSMDSNP